MGNLVWKSENWYINSNDKISSGEYVEFEKGPNVWKKEKVEIKSHTIFYIEGSGQTFKRKYGMSTLKERTQMIKYFRISICLLFFNFPLNSFASSAKSNDLLIKQNFKLCLERIFQVDDERMKFNIWPEKLIMNCSKTNLSYNCEISMNSKLSKNLSGTYKKSGGYIDLEFTNRQGDSVTLKQCGIEDRETEDLSSKVICNANVRIKQESVNGSSWVSYFRGLDCPK